MQIKTNSRTEKASYQRFPCENSWLWAMMGRECEGVSWIPTLKRFQNKWLTSTWPKSCDSSNSWVTSIGMMWKGWTQISARDWRMRRYKFWSTTRMGWWKIHIYPVDWRYISQKYYWWCWRKQNQYAKRDSFYIFIMHQGTIHAFSYTYVLDYLYRPTPMRFTYTFCRNIRRRHRIK